MNKANSDAIEFSIFNFTPLHEYFVNKINFLKSNPINKDIISNLVAYMNKLIYQLQPYPNNQEKKQIKKMLDAIILELELMQDSNKKNALSSIQVLLPELHNELNKLKSVSKKPEIDEELVDVYYDEAQEILQQISDILSQWQHNIENSSYINDILRELHTMKGGARMVEQDDISEFIHTVEQKYEDMLQSNALIIKEDYDLMTDIYDALTERIELLKGHNKNTNLDNILNKISAKMIHQMVVPEEKDSELLQIFWDEFNEIAEKTKTIAGHWKYNLNNMEDIIKLKKEFHTLRGSAVIVEHIQVSSLTMQAEWLLNKIIKKEIKINDLVYEVIEKIILTLDQIQKSYNNKNELFDTEGIIDEVQKMISSLCNEEIKEAEYEKDDVLETVFIEEASDIISNLSEISSHYRDDLSNLETLRALHIELHTLKSGAIVVNQSPVIELSNVLEDFFKELLTGRLEFSSKVADLMLESRDVLASILEAMQKKTILPSHEEITNKIKEYINTFATNNIPTIHPQIMDAPGAIEDKKGDWSFVRIATSVLEKISNLINESNISNVHVIQKINEINLMMGYIKQTMKRMIEDLRRLNIEADVYMLEKDNHHNKIENFDFLEMDRYSKSHGLTSSIGEYANELFNFMEKLNVIIATSDDLLTQQSRIYEDLQNNLIKSRMVSFSSIVPRLRRIVKQVSKELNKQVDFESNHVDGQMDRAVLEKIVPALEHLLRNAIDHGIEEEQERQEKGKKDPAIITLSMQRTGNDVIINISDNGKGINMNAIYEKAIRKGIASPDKRPSDENLLRFILLPGFSTREQVTQISGRGIGLDVVNTEVKKIGGSLSIMTKEKIGTTFSIKLPFTLSLNHGLLFELQGATYAIHLSQVVGIARITKETIPVYFEKQQANFFYANKQFKLVYLGNILGVSDTIPDYKNKISMPVIVIKSAEHEFAVVVDEIIGSREITVKTMGTQLQEILGCAGATVSADGKVILILDAIEISVRIKNLQSVKTQPQGSLALDHSNTSPLIMVVDDSPTILKVTTSLLERENYQVISATDGVAACKKLEQCKPDVILLDLEMPRMDGFEFADYVKRNESTKHIPIIVISSRTGEKHRERAFELGVNRFIGKPYQNIKLLELIKEVMQES